MAKNKRNIELMSDIDIMDFMVQLFNAYFPTASATVMKTKVLNRYSRKLPDEKDVIVLSDYTYIHFDIINNNGSILYDVCIETCKEDFARNASSIISFEVPPTAIRTYDEEVVLIKQLIQVAFRAASNCICTNAVASFIGPKND